MLLTNRPKNKNTVWTTALKPKVLDVVSNGGITYINISGINGDIADTNHWLPTGGASGSGSSTIIPGTNKVVKEILTGAVDGSNTVFSLSNTPVTGTECIFKNGLLQMVTADYTIAGAVVTMATAPLTGNVIAGSYDVASTTQKATREVPSGTINGTNAAFTLAHTPLTGSEEVFLNGQLKFSGVDYNISGANITMITIPLTSNSLVVNYLY